MQRRMPDQVPGMNVKKDAPPRLTKEKAYQYIRDQIVQGKIAEGTFIEEEDISNSIGVSRTPVREAFFRLEAERFIDLIPRRGAFVRQITAQELINVYETRRVIEIHAARKIAEDPTIAVPQEMFDLLEAMREAGKQHKFWEHIKFDVEFHRRLVETTRNEVMLEVYDSLQGRKLRVAYTAFKLDPNRLDILLREHTELLDALVKRDAARASRVLQEHLRPVFEIVSALPQQNVG